MSIVACGTEAMHRAHHDSRLNGPHAVDLRAASAHLDERRGEVGVLLADDVLEERGGDRREDVVHLPHEEGSVTDQGAACAHAAATAATTTTPSRWTSR